MKKSGSKNLIWTILVLLVVGGVAWWMIAGRHSNSRDGTDAKELVSNAGHEAKKGAVKITMQVAAMSVTGIDNDRINGINKVVMNNPLPVPLKINRIDYSVEADGIKVAEGAFTTPVRIAALSDTTLSLPMQTLVQQMDKVNDAAKAAGRDSAHYVFYNTIHTDVPIAGSTKIPYHVKTRLPVLWTPKVKPGDMDIDDFGFRNSEMGMTLHVTNPNSFTIRMMDGRFAMAVDGKSMMKGTMQKEVVLPPKQTVPVRVHTDMKTGRALKAGWKMLLDKKDARYELTFDSKLASNRKLLQNSSMHFTEEGYLKDLKEELKKMDE